MYARAAKAYKQVDLESSSKAQILDKLYLRFVRDCHELAPDLCGNLAALYDYVLDSLSQANIHNNGALLDQASAVMIQLREAFLEANRANG